jgi:hypothetical protein
MTRCMFLHTIKVGLLTWRILTSASLDAAYDTKTLSTSNSIQKRYSADPSVIIVVPSEQLLSLLSKVSVGFSYYLGKHLALCHGGLRTLYTQDIPDSYTAILSVRNNLLELWKARVRIGGDAMGAFADSGEAQVIWGCVTTYKCSDSDQ